MREYLQDETILDYLLDQSDWKNLKVFLKDNKISEDLLNNVLMKVSRRHSVCAEIVKELLKSGANPNICDERNMAPLNYICARSQNIHAISYLIDCGSYLNRKNIDFGESPLHHAFCLGNVEITKKLLQHGADPNATNNLKETSLHLLAQNPEQIDRSKISKAFQLLFKYPFDINAQNYDRETPIYCAVYFANMEGIQSLMEVGANWNIRDDNGISPLESALSSHVSKRLSIVKCILINQHLFIDEF